MNGPSIDLEDAVLDGSMFVIEDPMGRGPEIRGRMGMASMRIGGRLLFRNATIQAHTEVPKDSIYARPTAFDTALDAVRLSVGAEVLFTGQCAVTGRVDMSIGEMSGVSIGAGCVLRAPGRTVLNLTNSEIRADVRLDRDATVEGTIRLAGAVIHGMLALRGQLSQPERRSLVGGTALTVDGDVTLDGLRTGGGRVNFRGATLGSLAADGAQLNNPGGYSVSLNQARVQGSVRLVDGFSSTGLVVLNRSTIEGPAAVHRRLVHLSGAGAYNQHGHAVEAISATVRGGIDLDWAAVAPSVDFTDTTTTFLADDPDTWPPRFDIAGLTYERFETPQFAAPKPIWDQAARCAWLSRQAQFDSGPYEQAARVFREHGYADEAEQILMAQRRHARRVDRSNAAWPRRAADGIYAAIGYGYRPSRVLWALAVLLLLVVVTLELPASQTTLRATNGNGAVYSTRGLLVSPGGPPAGGGSSRRRFVRRRRGPLLQPGAVRDRHRRAADLARSTIDVVSRPARPCGEVVLWWLNLATLLGWLLSSIFVLSLTRLSREPVTAGPARLAGRAGRTLDMVAAQRQARHTRAHGESVMGIRSWFRSFKSPDIPDEEHSLIKLRYEDPDFEPTEAGRRRGRRRGGGRRQVLRAGFPGQPGRALTPAQRPPLRADAVRRPRRWQNAAVTAALAGGRSMTYGP